MLESTSHWSLKLHRRKTFIMTPLAGHRMDGMKVARIPFHSLNTLLGTILAAYKDFEDRFSIVETKLPAIDMVRKAAQNKIGRFNKQDIRGAVPVPKHQFH